MEEGRGGAGERVSKWRSVLKNPPSSTSFRREDGSTRVLRDSRPRPREEEKEKNEGGRGKFVFYPGTRRTSSRNVCMARLEFPGN